MDWEKLYKNDYAGFSNDPDNLVIRGWHDRTVSDFPADEGREDNELKELNFDVAI